MDSVTEPSAARASLTNQFSAEDGSGTGDKDDNKDDDNEDDASTLKEEWKGGWRI